MLNFLLTLQAMITDRIENNDKGATAVEYGLLVALIAAVIVVTVGLVGQDVLTGFTTIATQLP